MALKSSTTTGLIIIFLIFSLAEADLLTSPTPAANGNFGTCPENPLQLGVCANVLGLTNVSAGDPRAQPCCNSLTGLTNLQVSDCLCYVFRQLPSVFTLDEAIRRILFACNRAFPIGFQCPPSPTPPVEMTMG